MKNESVEQGLKLGMVAVKVIVIFLLIMVSLLLGAIWYRSEVEISILNGNGDVPLSETNVPTGDSSEIEAPSEAELITEMFSGEREIPIIIVELDEAQNMMVVSVPGISMVNVMYTEDTSFVFEDGMDESLTLSDITTESSGTLKVTEESILDLENLVAEEVIIDYIE